MLTFCKYFYFSDMSEGNGPGTADIDTGNQGLSVVRVSIPNSAIQVQPVIQAGHPSVIQNAGNYQTIQIVRVNSFLIYVIKYTDNA